MQQNKIVHLGTVLLGICAGTALILAAVNAMTLAPIAASKARQRNDALMATLPGAVKFEAVEASGEGIEEVVRGLDANDAPLGYNYTIDTKGFGGLLRIMVGINNEGRVMDISILTSGETPGLGQRASEPGFSGQFHELLVDGDLRVVKTPSSDAHDIQAISGATITSTAVTGAVNTARSHFAANFKGAK